jgi:hypothetical protein
MEIQEAQERVARSIATIEAQERAAKRLAELEARTARAARWHAVGEAVTVATVLAFVVPLAIALWRWAL